MIFSESLLILIAILFLVIVLVKSTGTVERHLVALAHDAGINEFILGFVILGLFTSLPEITVAVFSSQSIPELSVGDLLGATLVLLALVIGLASVKFKLLKFNGRFKEKNVIGGILLISTMIIAIIDSQLTLIEGVVMLVLFFAYMTIVSKEFGIKSKHARKHMATHGKVEYIKVIIALIVLVVAAYFIVLLSGTLAKQLGVAESLIGIFILGIGTNLPEITILFVSNGSHQRDLALGNFFGSACVNVGILGLLTVLSNGFQISNDNFLAIIPTLTILSITLLAFIIFSWTGRKLDRKEGILLVGLYLSLVATELIIFFLEASY